MNLLRIALGDLKRTAKDRMAFLWLLAMPLAMAYVFGSATHGGGPQPLWIPVIDLDRHELSAIFVNQLRGEGYYVELKEAGAQTELKTKWPYGVVIPRGFGEAILQARSIKVPLVKGSGTPEQILQVQSRLLQAVVRFTQGLARADVLPSAVGPGLQGSA